MPSAGAKTRWFTEILDAASLSAESVSHNAAEIKLLDSWFGETLSALNAADLDFSPALPDDDTPVSYRIRLLGEFCAGFTYGVGIALSQRGQKPLPADTREIIEDFQSIDAIELEDAPDNGNESASTSAPAATVMATSGHAISGHARSGQAASQEDQEAHYIELLEYVRVGVLLVLEELRPVMPATQEKPS